MQVLVVKTSTAKTITYFLRDQSYPSTAQDIDTLAQQVLQGQIDLRNSLGEDGSLFYGTFDAAALCDDSVLNVDGTDTDAHITIDVNGDVQNSNAP